MTAQTILPASDPQIRAALRGVSPEDRKQRQIDLANSLLEFVREQPEDLIDHDSVDPVGEVLPAIYRVRRRRLPPSTPLSAKGLIMNAQGEPRLWFELERELAARNAPIRILTTTYIGAKDSVALQRCEEETVRRAELRLRKQAAELGFQVIPTANG